MTEQDEIWERDDIIVALRTDLEAARRCARLAQEAHDIVLARVAKLEAALKLIFAAAGEDELVRLMVDDAFKDTSG